MGKNKPFTSIAGGLGPTKVKAALEAKIKVTLEVEAKAMSEAAETKAAFEAAFEPVKMVPKKITCPRCDGDGVWHTSATGVRLATIGGPVVDTDRPCPECKGNKSIRIMITEEQDKAEKAERAARNKKAKAQIDEKARAAKKEIDAE